jgi:hypothetical protein
VSSFKAGFFIDVTTCWRVNRIEITQSSLVMVRLKDAWHCPRVWDYGAVLIIIVYKRPVAQNRSASQDRPIQIQI